MIPIHNHSDFSALDGLSTCEEIADRIEQLGLCGCALTDHGLVCGHNSFAKAMHAKGLKPIYGLEAYQAKESRKTKPEPIQYVAADGKTKTKTPRDAAHLILIAQNATGLRNLNILSDEANRTGFYHSPRLDWELLEKYNEGLIATSACLSGLISRDIERGNDGISGSLGRYLDIFRDRFYIELHSYAAEKQRRTNFHLWELAQDQGIPVVYANDAHYCNIPSTPIWLADGSFSTIGEVKPGDKVMGWEAYKGDGFARKLQVSTVENTVRRLSPLVKVTLESGREIICTPEHKWLTPSCGAEGKEYYCKARVGRSLIHVVDQPEELSSDLKGIARWLGGIFDGEGNMHEQAIVLSQSISHNPDICNAIEQALDDLKLNYRRDTSSKTEVHRWYLTGRQTLVNFLAWCKPVKNQKIINILYSSLKKSKDKVVSIEDACFGEVVSMTTSTGNYVAWGYASKNCSEEDYFTHEMILNMQMKSDYKSAKNLTVDGDIDEDYSHDGEANHYHPKSLYIMGEDEVREALSYLPKRAVDEAIANSDLIAEQCDVTLPDTRMHMPVFRVPEQRDNKLALRELAEAGIKKRYPEATEEVTERFEREFQALTDVDLGDGATLGDYFLINWDWIANFCKPNGILTGPGRGSAGGSILAYSLGITHIDPIKYNLQFERFWNPGRATGFPDIDTDVEQGRRAEVKEYLIDKYGADKVLSIGTHIKHKPKSAIEAAAKAYFGRERMKADNLYDIVNKVKEIIESTVDAGKQPDWPELWETVGHKLQPFKDLSDEWEIVFNTAERITGRISTYGIHASAVVVSDVTLPEILPSRSAKPATGNTERQLVTQVDMHEVEALGFLKLDLLGLRNLDTLAMTARLAGMEDFDWWNDIDYDKLDYSLLDSGHTLGLFQVENGQAAKRIAKGISACCLGDLAAIIALNRPGPLRSGAVERLLDRKAGNSSVVYPHPILEDVLQHTYGEMIYQEDVLTFFRKIGYDWSEADTIRWMMGKKKRDEMAAEYPRYLERAKEFMSEDDAHSIWELMADFSKYGFNIPHAMCYGKILAATIYAKT